MNIKDLILCCFGNDLLIKSIWACCGRRMPPYASVAIVVFLKVVLGVSEQENSAEPKCGSGGKAH